MTKYLLNLTTNFADLITVRDKSSLKYIKNLYSNKKVKATFDLASLIYKESSSFDKKVLRDEKILGISLTNTENRVKNLSKTYKVLSQSVCEVMKKNNNLFTKIFIFKGGIREVDIYHSENLFNYLKKLFPNRVELIQYTSDVYSFMNKIEECNYFICTRYHSALLAYISQCYMLIIPYHQKLFDLSEEIELSDYAIINSTVINENEILEKVFKLVNCDQRFKPKFEIAKAFQKASLNIQLFLENI